MSRIKHLIAHIKRLWENKNINNSKGTILQNGLKIFISSIRGFVDDKCFDKASTLTFYSLLSIIPFIAIGLGIAEEFGLAEQFAQQLKSHLSNQPQVAEKIIEFSNSMLKTTKGSILAGFGLVILFWTVFKMFGNIASSFNEIWKLETSRSLWQQCKTFIPMIVLFPLFIIGSSSAIIYMSTRAILATQSINILHYFGPFIQILFQLIPTLVSWVLLSFFYVYLPNTKVSWKAGAISGVIIGVIYFLWQWIYLTFQVKSSSYGTIYGSFAAVPLFLIWLNYSWMIILFGTELTYHIQQTSKD